MFPIQVPLSISSGLGGIQPSGTGASTKISSDIAEGSGGNSQEALLLPKKENARDTQVGDAAMGQQNIGEILDIMA
ncbi:MAG: hypothetical protein ACK481_05575 [Candidatus Melainabacteria bacterium]|jgi:hypothetical protein